MTTTVIWGALDRAEDLEEERRYRETESWNNMGGS